jgi:drug/metabolite transporter (DMT)-like permease
VSEQTAANPTTLQWAGALLLAACFLAASGLAIHDLLAPPFTDAQIHRNLVDTWEGYALGSVVIMLVVGVLTGVAGLVAWRSHRAKWLYSTVAVLGLVAVGLLAVAHVALSAAAARVTG